MSEVSGPNAALRFFNPLVDPDVETAARALSLMMLESETEAYLSISSSEEPEGCCCEVVPVDASHLVHGGQG